VEKQLLLALGNEPGTSDTLRFVAAFLGPRPDLRLTLFFAASGETAISAAQLAQEGFTVTQHGIEHAQRERAHALLARSREWLLEQGFAPEQVEAKLVTSHADVTRDIIREAQRGLYDAVVMGSRRASVWTEAIMTDSVSRRMLWQEVDFPIWICRRPLPDAGRHVLLCADGSPQSLRMADHIGFLLADAPGHTVTVLHVATSDSEEETKNIRRIMEATRAALLENGMARERVREKVLSARRISGAIERELETGHYAVVAVGRASGPPDALQKLFPASLSGVLLRTLDNFSMWVCK
jgi:nucleotide-binding universal stress UspA family protein